jgi:hypothetical protein
MAKVPFSKLKCKINETVKVVSFNEDVQIEIKQYLPVQDKLALISRVVEYAHMEDTNFSNPVKAEVLCKLEMVMCYTNLSFTDKQKEDLPKLYDAIYSSGLLELILNNIPNEERKIVEQGVKDSIEAIYQYINSIVGVMDTLTRGSVDNLIDIDTVREGIKALENSPVLQELKPMLGL